MNTDTLTVFEKAPVPGAVLKNAVPAMAAMLMVLIYNLADTFFIARTRSDILVAAVSLATPVSWPVRRRRSGRTRRRRFPSARSPGRTRMRSSRWPRRTERR